MTLSGRCAASVAVTLSVLPFVSLGCGVGTAGILAGVFGGGGGGGKNTPTSVTQFEVLESRLDTARILFTIADPDTTQVSLDLMFVEQGVAGDECQASGSARMIGRSNLVLVASDGNECSSNDAIPFDSVPVSSSGASYCASWAYASDLTTGLGYNPCVRLILRIDGRDIEIGRDFPFGNSAPEIREVSPPSASEVGGVVPLVAIVADGASDSVQMFGEFSLAGDADDEWRAMTPFGLSRPQVPASGDGVSVPFFWDTGVDLAGKEVDVVAFRLSAVDEFGGASAWVAGPLGFRVDNNQPPFAFIDSGAFVPTFRTCRTHFLLISPDAA